jgi:hypothetical protein
MRRVLTMVGIVAFIAVLSATSALAKGPSSATIEGPGIAGTIDIGGEPGSGEPGSSTTLGQLAEHAGLYAGGLGGLSDQQLATQRPDGDLGPELTLTWTVPTSETGSDTVVQRLYPYADAGALSYADAGQSFFGSTTSGGWYVGGEALTTALVEAGVPEQPPGQRPALAPIVAGLAIVCAMGLMLMLARRVTRHRRETVDALAHS